MSRTNRFVTGATLAYISQAVSLSVGLVLAPFLLHKLGQHDYGVWLLGFQVLSYLMLLDFGIIALLPRDLAQLTGKARMTGIAPDLSLVVGQTAKVVLYQMPVVILATAALWCFVPATWSSYRGLLAMILVGFVVAFPLRIFAATVEGLQDFKYFGTVNILVFLIGTAVTVALVLKGFRLYALAFSWIGMQVVSILAFTYRVWRRFPEALPRRLPPMDRKTLQYFFGRGFWVSLNQIATPLLSGSDLLLVGKLIGPAAVVPYSATGKLSGVLANQPQILMVSAVPGLSELKTGASKEHVRNVTAALMLAVLVLCGGIVTVVLAVNQAFVTRWLGAAQYGGLLLTLLLCVAMLIRQWNLVMQFVTFCFGHERRITLTVFMDGLMTAGAGYVLISLLGPRGGPLASMVGVCVVSLPSNLRALSREADTDVWTLVKPLWPWFWKCCVVAVFSAVAGSFWHAKTLAEIAVEAALAGLLYCAVMWPTAMRSPLAVYLRRIGSQISERALGGLFLRPVMRDSNV